MKLQRIVFAGGLGIALGLFAASSGMAAEGKAVYAQTCAACHVSGVGGAPKLGDKEAWAPRLAAGQSVLVASVLKGKGAMPPKGGNASLTDAEVKASVAYMVSQIK